MIMKLVLVLSIVVAAALLLMTWLRWSFQAAKPDEWLLRVRHGRLVNAGVGITLWRRLGDMVVRFSKHRTTGHLRHRSAER